MKPFLAVIKISTLFLLFNACNLKEDINQRKELPKKVNSYLIEGRLSLTDSKKIYLFNKYDKKVDSAKILNFEFVLQNTINKPDYYYLKLDKSEVKHPIVLENTGYKILLNNNKTMIVGGNLNTKLNNYQEQKQNYTEQKSIFLDEFSKLNLGLKTYLKQVDSIRNIEKNLFNSFIVENSNTVLASILIEQTNLSSKEVTSLKSKLKNTKNKKLVRKLDILIDDLKIAEAEREILRRKPAPLFSGINLHGKTTSLEKIIKGKKLFLIEFWASWCSPCRNISPRIKKLYQKYKRKGFDILYVSEDRNVSDWKNAVYIDGVENWHHIYDDFNRISSMFNVTSMPHMVLLDEKGRIIKNKISIGDLEKHLSKAFNPLNESN